MEDNKKLTSVRLPHELFDEFRILTIKTKFSFQKLAERAIYLYTTNEEFRKLIHEQLDTNYTGSI